MTANDHTSTISPSSARWAILIGVLLSAAGVLENFQLERDSFVNTEDFEFRFLSRTYLPALMLGLLITLIGSALWAWRAAIRELALYGIAIIILMRLSLALIPINIHGWTSGFLFVYVAGMLIGGLFLVFAVVGAMVQYRVDLTVKSGLVTFVTGLTLLIPASIGLFVSGVPTVLCPSPALTYLPALLLSSWDLQRAAVIVPVLLFFVWNPGLFRGDAGIPMRSYVLMAVATVLSVLDFVASWKLGLRYQGAPYTYAVCVVNIAWVTLLGMMFAFSWKKNSSFRSNLILHWTLFAWLCWYAFPYMGELI